MKVTLWRADDVTLHLPRVGNTTEHNYCSTAQVTSDPGTNPKSQHEQRSPYHLGASDSLEPAGHLRSAAALHVVPKLGRKEGNVRSDASPAAPFPPPWCRGNQRDPKSAPATAKRPLPKRGVKPGRCLPSVAVTAATPRRKGYFSLP